MVHCKGNQEIDKEKVNKIIGAECKKIDEKEYFGLVNPFLGFDRKKILQIFDKSLKTQDFIPNTMMTNASNSRWGIEFNLSELIDALPNTLIEYVVKENTKFGINKHKIGILTGNSPESGILLWEKINENIRKNLNSYLFSWDEIPGNDDGRLIRFLTQNFGIEWAKTAKIEKIEDDKTIRISTERNSLSLRLKTRLKKSKVIIEFDDVRTDEELIGKIENSKLNIYNSNNEHFLGDISFPEVFIESIPEMGLSMELKERFSVVKEVVDKGITNLCKRGATIVCIACNTTQYFSESSREICSRFEHKPIYVGIPETTYQYLKKNEIKEFDFLGINYVSDFKKWSAFKNLNEEKKFTLYQVKKKHINLINNFAFEVKKKMVSDELKQDFVNFIKNSTNTDTIILALTELSTLYNMEEKYIQSQLKKKTKKKFLDTLTILAEKIADMYTEDYLSEMGKLSNKSGNEK